MPTASQAKSISLGVIQPERISAMVQQFLLMQRKSGFRPMQPIKRSPGQASYALSPEPHQFCHDILVTRW